MSWPRRRTWILAAMGIILAVWAAYGSAVHNGAVWDDVWLTTKNPNLASFHGLIVCLSNDLWSASALGEHSEFYRPLPLLSYALDRAALGNVPGSYHLGNLLVHAASALALGAWIARRTRTRLHGLAAALVFATLPLASEPVFWISGRFDSMGLFFVLLALCFAQVPGRWTTAVVVSCAVAATACKEPFIVAPLFFAVDDFILVRRAPWTRGGRYAAILLAELLWLVLRHQIGVASPSTLRHVDLKTLGASYLFLVRTFGGILADGGRLDAFHPYAPLSASANVAVTVGLVAVTGAVAWLARRRGSELAARMIAGGWTWTLLALVPVTVAGPILEMVGDRYAYVPSVGLVLMLVGTLALAMRRQGYLGKLAIGAAVGTLVVLGAHRCRARAPDWASDRTLVLASLRTDPGNAYALGELGSQYALEHRWREAEDFLLQGIAKPNQTTWRAQTALCFVYLNVDRLDEATEQCHRSLEGNGENPRAWLNLATVETRQKRWAAALEHADHAIVWRPRYAEAHFVRALALSNLGRRDEARAAVALALEIDPAHQGAHTLASRLATAR